MFDFGRWAVTVHGIIALWKGRRRDIPLPLALSLPSRFSSRFSSFIPIHMLTSFSQRTSGSMASAPPLATSPWCCAQSSARTSASRLMPLALGMGTSGDWEWECGAGCVGDANPFTYRMHLSGRIAERYRTAASGQGAGAHANASSSPTVIVSPPPASSAQSSPPARTLSFPIISLSSVSSPHRPVCGRPPRALFLAPPIHMRRSSRPARPRPSTTFPTSNSATSAQTSAQLCCPCDGGAVLRARVLASGPFSAVVEVRVVQAGVGVEEHCVRGAFAVQQGRGAGASAGVGGAAGGAMGHQCEPHAHDGESDVVKD
ncbi:hypothetical protein MVEN_00141800 [Mycena venus]|uniref:Uncharacterized protein n=1 Tax=Mycena venus TaxID=2733690 RepID=A0A8H6YZL0_9AGAR|nr:hypothetical protein MVEN_00141800 [Mycena venus]